MLKYSFANNKNINFTSKNNSSVRFGYDDSISGARREYLRSHCSGFLDDEETKILYSGRLEEYELNSLIASLAGAKVNQDAIKPDYLKKPKTSEKTHGIQAEHKTNEIQNGAINRELMDEIPAFNIFQISGSNSYRGATCDIVDEDLAIMKKAGIKRFVDLAGYVTQKDCDKADLEYFHFRIGSNFYKKSAFKNRNEIIGLNTKLYRDILGMNEAASRKAVEQELKTFEIEKKNFIKKFVAFIQTMQKDNVYIGCEFGAIDTDTALMFNFLFNPKAQDTPSCIQHTSILAFDKIRNLYENLTDSDKAEMGWDEEFDRNFLPKLEMYEKQFAG